MNLRDQNPRLESKRPWQSREEFLVDVALNAARSTDEAIRTVRPPVNAELFPERRGFAQEQPTIQQVLNVDRWTPTNRSWLSGIVVRPSIISDHSWSGTARNSMSEGTF